ncbi:hypothetical protein GH714_012302 [Hevea brasiliensis]|uniref:Uncharacterized protein n=1 Tax=Hevea brasiliensis TaxID=3981 RepID=A0A6A6M8C5_HEVBR|nr:hypothetical protein GH714_012302 [Hevea brasiliensis]
MMSSSTEDVDTKHRINGALYSSLIAGDKEKTLELCRKVSDHALHRITVDDDTVLHMATYAKEATDLVLKLLDELPEHHLDKLTRQNTLGNTILREAATNINAIPIAEKLLQEAPGLLGMGNRNGETALFRAARYGNTAMFKSLASKITQYDQVSQQFYLQSSDKTTVLRTSIISQHFELAWYIADEYRQLIDEKDMDRMTALQLLACEPSAFKNDHEDRFINLGEADWSSAGTQEQKANIGETPLILATESGCVEIMKEMLRAYPQAVEHVDDDGRNILHVAIKYRQLKIFEYVKACPKV